MPSQLVKLISDLMIGTGDLGSSFLDKLDGFFLKGEPKSVSTEVIKQLTRAAEINEDKALYVYQHRDDSSGINRSYFNDGELAVIFKFLDGITVIEDAIQATQPKKN